MALATRTTCRAELGLGGPTCTQVVGLSSMTAPDGTVLAYCRQPGHRERVARYAVRNHGSAAVGLADVRCRSCGSYRDARGCSNAGCGLWMGPDA